MPLSTNRIRSDYQFEVIRFSAQTSGHQRDLRSPDFSRHTE